MMAHSRELLVYFEFVKELRTEVTMSQIFASAVLHPVNV